jgi:hypothetical protein
VALNRHAFGGGAADWAFTWNSDGTLSSSPGAVIMFYDSLVAGNLYGAAPMPGGVDDGTGLLDSTGTPISSVTCDSSGEIPDAFLGPAGIYLMAADASGTGAGPRRWLYANDFGNDLITLLTQEAADVAALAFLNTYTPVYNYWNPALPGYPPRPATGAPVWWIGPVAPAFGGAAAVDGLDFYQGPQS